jgi:hypothetical protein
MCYACGKKCATHAEHAAKNVIRLLSMRQKNCAPHAEHAVKNVIRMLNMR